MGGLGFSVGEIVSFDFDQHPGILYCGAIFEWLEGRSRRDTTNKRGAVGMKEIVGVQPVF